MKKYHTLLVVAITVLVVVFNIFVMPFVYYRYIVKKPMKPVSLILYLTSLVFLAFVGVYGYRTYIKVAEDKKQVKIKEEMKRITINENNNLFA